MIDLFQGVGAKFKISALLHTLLLKLANNFFAVDLRNIYVYCILIEIVTLITSFFNNLLWHSVVSLKINL